MKTVLRNPRTSSPSLLECLTAHTLVNLCFTSDARVPLEAQGFGRIHHRILFFVNQRPGITVNELISVMRVSHQNLRGSMRQLIDQGYLLSKVGEEDRRQKRTFTSAKGLELIERLSHTQFSRIQKAFAAAGPEAVKAFLNVHRLLMDADDVQWMNEAAELRADQ
jgi:DNA-binding MarR family transcriptional regulator